MTYCGLCTCPCEEPRVLTWVPGDSDRELSEHLWRGGETDIYIDMYIYFKKVILSDNYVYFCHFGYELKMDRIQLFEHEMLF